MHPITVSFLVVLMCLTLCGGICADIRQRHCPGCSPEDINIFVTKHTYGVSKVQQIAAKMVRCLQEEQFNVAVIGGNAVVAHGVDRETHDVDMQIVLPPGALRRLKRSSCYKFQLNDGGVNQDFNLVPLVGVLGWTAPVIALVEANAKMNYMELLVKAMEADDLAAEDDIEEAADNIFRVDLLTAQTVPETLQEPIANFPAGTVVTKRALCQMKQDTGRNKDLADFMRLGCEELLPRYSAARLKNSSMWQR